MTTSAVMWNLVIEKDTATRGGSSVDYTLYLPAYRWELLDVGSFEDMPNSAITRKNFGNGITIA